MFSAVTLNVFSPHPMNLLSNDSTKCVLKKIKGLRDRQLIQYMSNIINTRMQQILVYTTVVDINSTEY